MYMFVNIRGRALQFTILGLFCLSVFAYYYTATNEIHQMAVLITSSQSSGIMVRSILNASGESQGTLSVKNATVESPSLNASSHDASNYQQMTTPSSLVSSQSSMILNVSKSIEQSLVKKPAKSQNTSESATPVVRNDSAAAIYQPGHSVSIPEKCPNLGAKMEVVILVMSAPTHFAARTAIRQTWGHFGQRKDVSVMFMLGDTTDKQISTVLLREEDMYRDVIRGNFIDSYSNLTLKTISALEWVQEYCGKVKFFLKTDDDMFINVPRLLSFVNKHSKSRNVIFGRLARRWKPIRNKKSKYYVSHSQYKSERFPDFTTGPAYLLSSDVVPKLYVESLKQTYLKLEDVFTTGIVAHKLGIKRYQANEFFNKRIPFNPCNIQRSVSIHMVKYSEQFDLWKKLLDGKSKCK
ncbi:beta-1,3-galactosyltransferase 5-like [Neodiprion fabricii]|uniref:beta-1,3-galactosyltransferase 5-like n=1 Tax=Neodiprion fabricii TaxID=2872261 RepID=UPI001ED8C6B3|nr:beta-1,3-galactosyltransferase 5-like [Neodiprion fabricii]